MIVLFNSVQKFSLYEVIKSKLFIDISINDIYIYNFLMHWPWPVTELAFFLTRFEVFGHCISVIVGL
jgi:hypothetical protein